MKCEICGKEITLRESHNGEPLVKGKVCENCNWKVIRERMRLSKSKSSNETIEGIFTPKTPEAFQTLVDSHLRKFGRIGGGLYDDLDEAGFYLDSDNKVQRKVKPSQENMATLGTDGPISTVDPIKDFEEYAKKFEEMFIIGNTPVRKEEPINSVKEKNGELTGEVKSMDKEEKAEQAEPIKDEKSSTESLLYAAKNEEIFEILRLSEQIGLETTADIKRFLKDHPGMDMLTALKEEIGELGEDFKIKEA